MSNVASLELCRELYELSAWGKNIKAEDLEIWGVASDGQSAVITSSSYASGKTKIGIPTTLIPAYDLGYLLRKLPKPVGLAYLDTGDCNAWHDPHGSMSDETYAANTDTPEDAACKLAIELFKQGILTLEKEDK